MGKLLHSTLLATWEDKFEDIEDAQIDVPTVDTLFRRYLTKIPSDLRSPIDCAGKVVAFRWGG
eukprot:9906824-Heterocapsa_arctica.AAC.1